MTARIRIWFSGTNWKAFKRDGDSPRCPYRNFNTQIGTKRNSGNMRFQIIPSLVHRHQERTILNYNNDAPYGIVLAKRKEIWSDRPQNNTIF